MLYKSTSYTKSIAQCWHVSLIAAGPQDCDSQILVAFSTGVVTLDLDSGDVEPFAPNQTLFNVVVIAADPANGYAFFTDVSRDEIWRKDFYGGSEVIYHLPSGDNNRSTVHNHRRRSRGAGGRSPPPTFESRGRKYLSAPQVWVAKTPFLMTPQAILL